MDLPKALLLDLGMVMLISNCESRYGQTPVSGFERKQEEKHPC